MAPKHSAGVLSNVPKHKEAVKFHVEKNMGDRYCSGMSYSAMVVSSKLMNQQFLLSRMSLNRSTHIKLSSVLIS